MTYAVDFRHVMETKDLSYTLERCGGRTTVTRQLLPGSAPALFCDPVPVPDDELPTALRVPVMQLRKGAMPDIGKL